MQKLKRRSLRATQASAWILGLFTTAFLLAAPHGAMGQTTLPYTEDFESQSVGDQTDDAGVWSLSGTGNTQGGYHFEIKEQNSDNVLEGQNLDGAAVWATDQSPIDISNASNPGFSLVISKSGGLEGSDYVDVEYSTDGGSNFTLVEDYNGLGSSSHTLEGDFGSSVTVTQTGLSGSSLVLRVTMENSAESEEMRLDDVQVTDQTNPTVQFTSSETSLQEDDGSATLTVELQNATGTQVEADVAFQSGTSSASTADIDGYSTQSVTFNTGAANGDTKDVAVTLTDDSQLEGQETAEFALTNVSGGEATGGPSELEIVDTEVVINEVLADPPSGSKGDANGDGTRDFSQDEFIEIYNHSGSQLDLNGFTLDTGGSQQHEFGGAILDPGQAVVVFGGVASGESIDSSIPGIVQTATGGNLSLSNGGDDITVRDASGDPYLSLSYGGEGGDAQSLTRDPDFTGEFVKHSNATGAGGALFSPGEQVSGSPLPVEFTSFEVASMDEGARLTWQTASETDNSGFEVQRKVDGSFRQIGFVEGAGTTSEAQSYRFETEPLTAGTHTFRLKQVDLDGTPHYSEPKSIRIRSAATLTLSGPNPLPAGQSATVTVQGATAKRVDVTLYNTLGRRVRTVATTDDASGGTIRAEIDTESLASGVYFLRATTPSFTKTRRIAIVR